MIVRCDSIEKIHNGVLRIFGSPLVVSQGVDPGYGWYNLEYESNPKYYEYDGTRFTGNVLRNPPMGENRQYSYDMDINRLKYLLDNKDQIKTEMNQISLGNYLFTYDVEDVVDQENEIKDLKFRHDMKAFAVSKDLFYEKNRIGY